MESARHIASYVLELKLSIVKAVLQIIRIHSFRETTMLDLRFTLCVRITLLKTNEVQSMRPHESTARSLCVVFKSINLHTRKVQWTNIIHAILHIVSTIFIK